MNVYIAAPYRMKELIKERAAELRAGGVVVTSTWIDEPHKPSTQMQDLTHEEHQAYAVQDVKDVMAADILLLHTDPTKSIVRQGRTVEMGIFVGRRAATHRALPIFVVGLEYENIFHHLPQVTHFATWEEVRDLVIALNDGEPTK